MKVLGGEQFLMSEVPLYHVVLGGDEVLAVVAHEERETLPFLHRTCFEKPGVYLCIYHPSFV